MKFSYISIPVFSFYSVIHAAQNLQSKFWYASLIRILLVYIYLTPWPKTAPIQAAQPTVQNAASDAESRPTAASSAKKKTGPHTSSAAPWKPLLRAMKSSNASCSTPKEKAEADTRTSASRARIPSSTPPRSRSRWNSVSHWSWSAFKRICPADTRPITNTRPGWILTRFLASRPTRGREALAVYMWRVRTDRRWRRSFWRPWRITCRLYWTILGNETLQPLRGSFTVGTGWRSSLFKMGCRSRIIRRLYRTHSHRLLRAWS